MCLNQYSRKKHEKDQKTINIDLKTVAKIINIAGFWGDTQGIQFNSVSPMTLVFSETETQEGYPPSYRKRSFNCQA
jgi:hypothetical protein